MNIRFNRILIIRLSAVGDVINTLPVLKALRDNFPKSLIAWVVEDRAKDILLHRPDLDKVFVFERQRWSAHLRPDKGLIRTLQETDRFIRSIRDMHFDIVLDLQGNLKSGLVTYLSKAPVRVGFNRGISKELNHLFANYRVNLDHQHINRVEKNLMMLKQLGLPSGGGTDRERGQPAIHIPAEDEVPVERFLKEEGLANFIVFHPGTSDFGVYKRWSLANYASLGDRLLKMHEDLNILLTWGPAERDMVEEIAQKMGGKKPVLACETGSLTQLAVLLKRARLFVGSDSAPLHLASFLRVPTVALFGPKDPVIYGPYYNHHSILIRKDIPCSPCQRRTCPYPDCMHLITVEEVFQAVQRLLNGN